MVVVSSLTEGTAKIFALGLGHTVAFVGGALALAVGLRRRVHEHLFPRALLPAVAVSAALAALAWGTVERIDPSGRWATAAVLAVVGALGLMVWWGAVRVFHLAPERLVARPGVAT
jgi:hypothetical protein